ncbi:MAG TPA: BrnA antitoxin family protein [Coxiellaceae bacterium]|nr:BrnA antitoxin family protein [Coxiellaceae bacterium]
MKEKFITEKLKKGTNWKWLQHASDKDIDYRDIPPTNAKFWEGASVATRPKTHLSIRLDSDIVAYFKKRGVGYQTRINEVLRAYLKAHGEPTPPVSVVRTIKKTRKKKK